MAHAVGGVGRALLGQGIYQSVDRRSCVQEDKVVGTYQLGRAQGDDALLVGVLAGALGHGDIAGDALEVKRHGAAVHLYKAARLVELLEVSTDR